MRRNAFIIIFCAAMVLSIFTIQINAEKNLLSNGDFEQSPLDNPKNWTTDNGAAQTQSVFGLTEKKTHGGKHALMIKSDVPNDARVIQTVNVKPKTYYRFSGWVAVADVAADQTGANLSIIGTWTHSSPLNGTADWTYQEINIKTHATQTQVQLAARLGMWGSVVTGTAYFDDLSLIKLKAPPPTYDQLDAPPGQTNSKTETDSNVKTDSSLWIILTLWTIFLLVLKILSSKNEKRANER
jgi:dolichyl-phosphate-mannose-protein mannosyltransferase